MKESARKLVGTDQLCWISSLGTVTENLMSRWGGKHGAEWDVDEIPWKTETCSFFDCRITSLEGKHARGHVLAEGRSFNKTLPNKRRPEQWCLGFRNILMKKRSCCRTSLRWIALYPSTKRFTYKILIEESHLHRSMSAQSFVSMSRLIHCLEARRDVSMSSALL